MCSGAPLMATHAYEEPREPYRKGEPREPYRKGDRSTTMGHTRFQGEHTENEHWRLVEDRNGQVGYAPATFLVVILDKTAEEERKPMLPRRDKRTVQRKSGLEEGLDRRENEAGVIQRQ